MPGREGALISVPCLTISPSHTLCQGLIGVVKGRLALIPSFESYMASGRGGG